MKYITLRTCCLLFICLNFSFCKSPDQQLKLWYDSPANNWIEGLPIGNCLLGAMVYGRPGKEIITLNHCTFWSGAPTDWNNPGAAAIFPQVKELMAQKKFAEAENLCKKMQGPYNQSYQPLGELRLTFPDSSKSSNYSRDLDLSNSLSHVNYTAN